MVNSHTHAMTLRLSPLLIDAIDFFARKMNCTRSQAIRYLCSQSLVQHGILKSGVKDGK